jgi:hypothetical protein
LHHHIAQCPSNVTEIKYPNTDLWHGYLHLSLFLVVVAFILSTCLMRT